MSRPSLWPAEVAPSSLRSAEQNVQPLHVEGGTVRLLRTHRHLQISGAGDKHCEQALQAQEQKDQEQFDPGSQLQTQEENPGRQPEPPRRGLLE